MDHLTCAPLIVHDLNGLYKNEFLQYIPLGQAPLNSQEEALLLGYLLVNRPLLSTAFYRPARGRCHEEGLCQRWEPLLWHSEQWPQNVNKLIQTGETCFVTSSEFDIGHLDCFLPNGYSGRVIRRGSRAEDPFLLEWNADLVHGALGEAEGMDAIWTFDTLGVILPESKTKLLETWARAGEITPENVGEFFFSVSAVFAVAYDLDGILVLSYKYDAASLSSLLGVPLSQPEHNYEI